jgi:CTP synthase (UTP-ammonia lyase)
MNEMNKFTKVVASALVVMMTVPLAAQAATLAELTETKNTAHEIAEKARSIGLSEDHIIIQGAQSVWWDAQNDIATGNYEAEVEKPATTVKYYTDNDVIMLAKVAYCECYVDYPE